MGLPALKVPTLADLDALPRHIKGEIIEGVLYTMTRPRAAHQYVGGAVSQHVWGPFHQGKGGPGGWWILPEPGIEVEGSPEFSPDVAGWRRERMPTLPKDASLTVVPDWICEVLSPTTRRHNLLVKKPFYARLGVPWLWFIDLDARTLSVFHLQDGRWVELSTLGDETAARIPPFEDVALDLTAWWEGLLP